MAVVLKGNLATASPKKPRKRTKQFTQDDFDVLIAYLESGESLEEACAHPNMPHPSTVYRRTASDAALAARIKAASKAHVDREVHGVFGTLKKLLAEAKTSSEKARIAAEIATHTRWYAERRDRETYGKDFTGDGAVIVNFSPDNVIGAVVPAVPVNGFEPEAVVDSKLLGPVQGHA